MKVRTDLKSGDSYPVLPTACMENLNSPDCQAALTAQPVFWSPANSNLQFADDIRSQAEIRLEEQRKGLVRNFGG